VNPGHKAVDFTHDPIIWAAAMEGCSVKVGLFRRAPLIMVGCASRRVAVIYHRWNGLTNEHVAVAQSPDGQDEAQAEPKGGP
jgi:hypothetical protein